MIIYCFYYIIQTKNNVKQEAQLSQWDALTGCVLRLCENKNVLPIVPFNTLSHDASHMHINAAVSEILRLQHNAIARGCTEIVVKGDFEAFLTNAF